jgi:hypothetical protein
MSKHGLDPRLPPAPAPTEEVAPDVTLQKQLVRVMAKRPYPQHYSPIHRPCRDIQVGMHTLFDSQQWRTFITYSTFVSSLKPFLSPI